MAVETVRVGQKGESLSDRDRLFAAWEKIVPQIRALEARRVRKGQQPAAPLKVVKCSLDEGEEPSDFLNEAIDHLLEIVEEDAEGKKVRYRCMALGEGKTTRSNRPELAKEVMIETEERTAAEKTRESEVVRALEVYVKGSESLWKNANNLIKIFGESHQKLSDALTTSNGDAAKEAKWRFKAEMHRTDREADLQATIEELGHRAAAHERRHATITELFGEKSRVYGVIDQLFAFLQSSGHPPSDGEIDAAFRGVDEDMPKLLKRIRSERDEQQRAALLDPAKKRWAELGREKQAKAIAQLREFAGDARAMVIYAWLKSIGIVE